MRDVVMGVAAAVTYAVIYFTARDVIVPLWFRQQTRADAFAAEFAVRTCTLVVSLLAVCLGWFVITDPALIADRIGARSAVLERCMPIGLVTFGLDVLAKWQSYRTAQAAASARVSVRGFMHLEWIILLHHVLIALMIAVLMVVRRGEYFAGHILLCEASALPLQLRWLLSVTGGKASLLYAANGLALVVTHFYTRILVFPRILIHYGAAKGGVSWPLAFTLLPLQCQVGTVLLAALQAYWFYLMLRALWKRVRYVLLPGRKPDRP